MENAVYDYEEKDVSTDLESKKNITGNNVSLRDN